MNARRFDRPQSAPAHRAMHAFLIVACMLIVSTTGCRLCDNSEDLAYPTYGGAWQRTVRDQGRVGSLFDPAGAKASELVSRDTPIPADELERSRQEPTKKPKYSEEDEAADEDAEAESTENGDPEIDSDSNSEMDEDDDSSVDSDLEERKRKLREQQLEEIKIVPGDPLPPVLR